MPSPPGTYRSLCIPRSFHTALYDCPVLQDEYFVGMAYRAAALGNYYGRQSVYFFESGAKISVGERVERRRRVVEDKKFGRFRERAGDRKSLPLSARKVFAAGGYGRVQKFGLCRDKVVCLRGFQSGYDFFVVYRLVAHLHIVAHRARKQPGFLCDYSYAGTKLF